MNDIQFEAFSLYAGMRMDGMSKLDAFHVYYTMLAGGGLSQTDMMTSAIELYTWLREKVKLDDKD